MEINVIDILLDENNHDNIFLYDNEDNEYEFEQVALIPLDDKIYVILRPLDMEGVKEDEAFVFELKPLDEEIICIDDDEIINLVFSRYYELFNK